MTLVKFRKPEPARPFFSNLFDNFFTEDFPSLKGDFFTTPAVNVKETATGFQLAVSAPGFNRDKIKLTVDNNQLTIAGEMEEYKEENGERFTRREFRHGSFERQFTLPDSVNADAIKANYENGILTVEIPKKEEFTKPSKREIKLS